ncbi:class A beta-lactamase [Altererythrobacter sp.]|uniref:class A beta-lactamase n=1 Tax=Altererythrobacter sp. TaxID=1872480 RepID=UPI003CFF1C0A
MTSRRSFMAGGAALAASACVPIDTSPTGRLSAKLRIIEAASGGTLGVGLLDAENGAMLSHNAQMRFGHCSSFKFSLAAMVLARAQSGAIDADEHVTWSKDDLMSVSPFTTKRIEEGATLRELAEAAQKYSDNAAANILLKQLGGPEALTAFWREIGDGTSRLDRIEPALNNVPPGEERDTTTPTAMARTVYRLAFGSVLDPEDQQTLRQWTTDTKTGVRRVRAGLPESWPAGDKTGTSNWPGVGSIYVDVGWVHPPEREPLTFATYFQSRSALEGMDPASEQVLAQVGEVLAAFALHGSSPA